MQIDNSFSNRINIQDLRNSSGGSEKDLTKGNSDTISSANPADEPLRPMRTYKGHGMLEQYPANLTVAYVSGHESRHANKNKSEAGKEGTTALQNVSYKIQISPDGQLMATGGVTVSRNSSQGSNMEKSGKSLDTQESVGKTDTLSPKAYENIMKGFHLARKKESLERDLRTKGDGSMQQNGLNEPQVSEEAKTTVSDSTEKKLTSLSEKLETINIRRKISLLEEEKRGISKPQQSENQAAGQTEKKAPESIPASSGLPVEEHTDLSNVAPASYHAVQRDIPNAVLINGFGSANEINQALNLLDRFNPQSSIPKSASLEGKSILQQFDALSAVSNRFKSLNFASNELGSPASFNTRPASSSFPEAVNAQTGAGSPSGSFRISVANLALPHKIVSNQQSDPFASLGLSGSFKINGYQVGVAASDSLNSLKDKINYGEDVNKNSQLDYAEDMNGNGALDVFRIKPSVGSNHITIREDVDLNGILNGTEDVNGNRHLDGGTANTGVKADIKFNRLSMETVKTGNNIISTDDSDGILQSLGFYFQDNKGVTRETAQFDSTYSEQYNTSPTPAQFSVNGLNLARPSNEVNDVLPDTTLQLKQATSDPVNLNVKIATDSSKGKIENFAKEYNSSISTINNFLKFEKTLQSNAIVQNLRAQLVDHVNKPVEFLSQKMNSLATSGLEIQNTEKHSLSAFVALMAPDKIINNNEAISSYRAQGDATIYSEMREVGIKTQQDDTLKVNDKKLSAALQDSPMDLERIYASNGQGVTDRLDSFFSDVLNTRGALDLEKQRINAYANGFSKSNDTYINVAKNKRTASAATGSAGISLFA
jgi:flagellar capping protein FliD